MSAVIRSKRIWLLIFLVTLVVGALMVLTGEKEEEVAPIVDIGLTSERSIIGSSVLGRTIDAYTYGDGDTHLMFVGGVHGGYEWNSVLLAYEFMDYLEGSNDVLPDNIKVTVIPSLNPDGVYKIIKKEGRFQASDVPDDIDTAPGRFNANDVDLNRNFDCKWEPESKWRGNTVSAGTEPFSEPEAQALRKAVFDSSPDAVIFWHSKANTVYASECTKGVLPETKDIMNIYSKAAGYNAVEVFDAYEITGDAEGWLASINIPAITVELKTHETIEWNQNKSGIEALFDYYR